MTIIKVSIVYFLSLFLTIGLVGNWAKNHNSEGRLNAQTIEKNLLINQILK